MNRYILIFLILASCSAGGKKTVQTPVKVETAAVEVKKIPIFIEAIGNLQAHSFVKIRPQVSGILTKSYVNQGDYVKKNDILFQIDPRPYKVALAEAEANLERDQALVAIAKKTYERNKELVEKEYISRLAYEQFEANLKSAEAAVKKDLEQVENAKINLGYSTIYSPIDGKVGVLNTFPGNLVTVSETTPLIEILQIVPIDVSFSIPQKEFQQLQKYNQGEGLKFEVTLPYDVGKKFIGNIFFVDHKIDLQTGTILLKGSIANEKKELLPGQFVTVKVFLREEPSAILIPERAIQKGPQGTYVFVLQNDQTVKVVVVSTGYTADGKIVINSGLSSGDKVVVNGQVNLRNGMLVEEQK